MAWTYEEEYKKLLNTLDQDGRPWRPITLIPTDGTTVYIKCGVSALGDVLYDVGKYEDYTTSSWWFEGDLEGEFDTEFGNCREMIGWKEVL